MQLILLPTADTTVCFTELKHSHGAFFCSFALSAFDCYHHVYKSIALIKDCVHKLLLQLFMWKIKHTV